MGTMLTDAYRRLGTLLVGVVVVLASTTATADEFHSEWADGINRVWIGPDYWANRLQDWRLAGGRIECVEASSDRPMRSVQLLTAALGSNRGTCTMSVRTGAIEAGGDAGEQTWTGFLIGAGGSHVDYRLTALVHDQPAQDGGLVAAIDGSGRIVFRNFDSGAPRSGGKPITEHVRVSGGPGRFSPAAVELRLDVEPAGDVYRVTLSAFDPAGQTLISRASLDNVSAGKCEGSLALVSHLGPEGSRAGYWFRDWTLSGSKVESHPQRQYGPILCAMHTLSRGTLKLTAQMPPVGSDGTQTARLEVRDDSSGSWRTAATASLVEHSYTFPFRVENWDAAGDRDYRIVYELKTAADKTRTFTRQGVIRREPADCETFVVAAFTGHRIFTGGLKWNHNGIWFPHNELVEAVKSHRPHLLFFSGDQIYESDLTGAQRQPRNKAMLDYLDKWYRWCWAFGDLARDVPCIAIPDDHDVYHGNIWGAGGRPAKRQDDGGYTMPARFVNMVQRTQTSHLPDPHDPKPVEQGIGVYYTSLDYGGLSFAVLEDRKWKSSPTELIPEGRVVNGWFENPDFDPAREADVDGATLLGDRQLEFLKTWAADWTGGAWMKVVLSQTLFANVATLPQDAVNDRVVPRLERLPPGVFPRDDKLVADADSNGWPQSGRNRALREMRRGFAFHIAGDQHLGSFVHYGIDDWDDAGYGFCVPSIANTWPRRWYPPYPGENRRPGSPPYTGQYRDGFGNRVTVYAVSNPIRTDREPAALYDRAPGYGIVRFDRARRKIVVECWPRWVDPSQPGAPQYSGWPVTVRQRDNYGRRAAAHLPTIEVSGMSDPVVQVIDETGGEVVYTLRISGTRFRPKVFRSGPHTIKVGEPGTRRMKTLRHVNPVADEDQTLKVDL